MGSRSNSLPHECFASRPQRHTAMTEATLLPFDLPAVRRKKLTVDFDGGSQSSDGGLLLLREAERSLGICGRLAGSLTDRRDPTRVEHQLIELIKTRVLAICCGHEDGTDLDRLRHDPLLKLAASRYCLRQSDARSLLRKAGFATSLSHLCCHQG